MSFITITIADLADSLQDHSMQIGELKELVGQSGQRQLNAGKFSKYRSAIGRWLYGYALPLYPDQPDLLRLEETNTKICSLATDVIDRINNGDIAESRLLFEQLLLADTILAQLIERVELWIGSLNRKESTSSLSSGSKLNTFLQSQVSFKALSEGTDVLILFIDQTRHVFYVNQAWTTFTGKSVIALSEIDWLNIIDRPDQAAVYTGVQRALKGEVVENFDVNAYQMCGKIKTFSFRAIPWLSEREDVSGCIVFLTDVDDIRKTQFENRIKKAVLDHCQLIIGISLVAPMPEPIYNNPYTLEKLGWTTGKGRTLIDAVYPADRDKVLGLLPDILKNKQGTSEVRLYNEITGEPFWVQWDVMIVKGDQHGVPDILFTISPDITERKLQQKLLESHYSTLMNAIDIARLGTWEVDLITGTSHFSQRHLEMFGVDSDMNMQEAINHVLEEERKNLKSAFKEALTSGSDGRFTAEYTVVNAKTGHKHVIQSIGQAYFDTDGKAVSISGIAQDITMFRDLQRALEIQVERRTVQLDESNKQLEDGNQQMKQINQSLSRSNDDLQRFAYVASHDLQEPLRKIQQFASRLEKETEDASEKAKDYLKRMVAAAERMSTLIDDLLSFSRISNESIKKQPVPLKKVLSQVISNLEDSIERTGATFHIGELPVIQGNSVQLEQLFQNLISNAIKFHQFAEDGAIISPVIHIDATRLAFSDLPQQVRPAVFSESYHMIRISDNGIGFDQIHLERIFQAFQRLHGRSRYSGTGIGLAICERIVHNHDGTITAESRQGQGATFLVYLPVEAS